MSNVALRLVKMVALLAAFGWLALMLHTYLLGAHGLNFQHYLHNLFFMVLATLMGFLLVWAALRVGARTTNFATPLLIAPPLQPGISPLESELLGFLQAYRSWPAHPPAANVYDQAFRRWSMMCGLPDTPLPSRIAALASVLPHVLGHTETRTPAPWWKLSSPDTTTIHPTGPVSPADIIVFLESLPAFSNLQAADQHSVRAVLLAPNDTPLAETIRTKLDFVIQHVG